MTSNKIVCAIAALSMSLSGLAMEQQDKDIRSDSMSRENLEKRSGAEVPREPGRRPNANDNLRNDRRDDGRRADDRRDYSRRDDGRRDNNYWRGDDRRGNNWRGEDWRGNDWRSDDRRGHGAGPDHNFYRGGRLPAYYRGHEYVVDDWRGHRLQAPPRGYQWVQVGPDYVLVAVATGIIAS